MLRRRWWDSSSENSWRCNTSRAAEHHSRLNHIQIKGSVNLPATQVTFKLTERQRLLPCTTGKKHRAVRIINCELCPAGSSVINVENSLRAETQARRSITRYSFRRPLPWFLDNALPARMEHCLRTREELGTGLTAISQANVRLRRRRYSSIRLERA